MTKKKTPTTKEQEEDLEEKIENTKEEWMIIDEEQFDMIAIQYIRAYREKIQVYTDMMHEVAYLKDRLYRIKFLYNPSSGDIEYKPYKKTVGFTK